MTPAQRRKPYPAYKPSGVEWLGDIPAHWEVKRLKHVAKLNPDMLTEEMDPDYVLSYVDITNVDSQGNVISPQNLPFGAAPSRARRKVRHGDTILSTVRTYLKAIAFMDEPTENLIVSTGFAVLRPGLEYHPRFLYRMVQSHEFVETVVAHSEWVGYPAINPGELAALAVWLPPFSEQEAIAVFLDRETAKIDALVAKKERLVELLQEKRAALITHAVTKGLDPSATSKPSGVDWLGDIPVHWEVMPLKRLGWLRAGAGFPEEEQGLVDQEIPFYKVDDMNLAGNECFMTAFTNTVDRETAKRLGAIVFPVETIVFPKVGAALLTNKRRILTRPSCIDNNVMGFVMHGEDVKYMFYRLCCIDFARLANPGAVPSMNESQAREIEVTAPPRGEQREIAAFLDRGTGKIDSLIGKVRQHIENLREYRGAVISAAVTGKIDVRETTA